MARAVAACPVQAILADALDAPGEMAAVPGEEESHGR